MGRSLGCSQASATIRQRCSAVICDGLPGRGASVSRSATDRSVNGTSCKLSQRPRQLRTVSTLTFSSLAISAFLFPSAESQDHASSFRQLLRRAVSMHERLQSCLFFLA